MAKFLIIATFILIVAMSNYVSAEIFIPKTLDETEKIIVDNKYDLIILSILTGKARLEIGRS